MAVMNDFDKRSFRRMNINSPVSIEHAGQTYQGVCLDLSSTGMSVSMDEIAINEGDDIAITLGAGQSQSPLCADGKVLRVQVVESSIRVGIELTKLN